MINFIFSKIAKVTKYLAESWLKAWNSKPGDWMEKAEVGNGIAARWQELPTTDPDKEFIKLTTTPIERSVWPEISSVREAYLFEGIFDERGKLVKDKSLLESKGLKESYVIRRYSDSASVERRLKEAETIHKELPDKVKKMKEARVKLLEQKAKAKESDADFDQFDVQLSQYDPNQYTEYAPTYGGPHFKQLYLYDMIAMFARAFEATNHNPLARRIVDVLAQYSMGRGFKALCKQDFQQAAWDKFCKDSNLKEKVRKFWVREYLIYGEIMVDKSKWISIDPSTIWDIITDPDNIDDVYYYHQNYPTAFFQFTGQKVPGVLGSEKTRPIEYIIRQLPYDRVIHIKHKCVSNEKRGRSVLFPVLGWLKRVKDLYNAYVLRAWAEGSFVFDDTIDGSSGDVDAHLSKYSSLPPPMSIFAHTKAIERKVMPYSQASTGGMASSGIGGELLAFIATAIGIPKDFFNVIGSGAGNRATALVGAEPFSKVIDDLQADFESLLLKIAEEVFAQNNIPYQSGDIEFIFPSIVKDTTTEMVTNIMKGEASGYINKRRAANMFAAEMNVTAFDFEEEQKKGTEDKTAGLDQAITAMPPDSRFGQSPKTPIAGEGKLELQDQLNTL